MDNTIPNEFSEHREFSHLHRFSTPGQYRRYLESIFKDERQFLTEIFLQLATGVRILPLNFEERNSSNASHFEMFITVQALSQNKASYSNVHLIKEAFGFNIISYFRILFDHPFADEEVSDLIHDIGQYYDLKNPSHSSFIRCIKDGIDPDSMEEYFNVLTSGITGIEKRTPSVFTAEESETKTFENLSPSSSTQEHREEVFTSLQYTEKHLSPSTTLNGGDPSCDVCISRGEAPRLLPEAAESKKVLLRCGGTAIRATVGLCDALKCISAVAPRSLPKRVFVVPASQFRRVMNKIGKKVCPIAQSSGEGMAYSVADLFSICHMKRKCHMLVCTSPCALPFADVGYVVAAEHIRKRMAVDRLAPKRQLFYGPVYSLLEDYG